MVTRFYKKGKRPFDTGNLIGGFKPTIDALVETGLLRDDSPQWLQAWYFQKPSPTGKDVVELVIEEQIEVS